MQINTINDALDNFCHSSGQKVSKEKTWVFSSKNVARHVRNVLCTNISVLETEDLGKYLGVPLLHARVTKKAYQYIIDKIRTKLSGWDSRKLSLAGRITLAQFVISTIPTYVMQTSLLPLATSNEVDKLRRKFV